MQYLEENLGASKIKLEGKELEELNAIVRSADVQGERYMSAMVSSLVADTPPYKG